MTTTTTAPSHKTTIDQHKGTHNPTGMRITEYKDVTTAFSDFSQERWESLSVDDQAWWSERLEAIHSAEVELESLDAEHRARVREWLLDNPANGVDDAASQIRQAITEAIEA